MKIQSLVKMIMMKHQKLQKAASVKVTRSCRSVKQVYIK